ncbi:cupin domain-containing protein [Pontibacter actiniarum]|uniref:Cupin type-2 domain-containing protein n=1 Tax=Pontibacter actiniarum TaxID=323450 RepID=A0A1X9YUN3_9BACT|nr:cupin domain-containing protein [Pontibacter actiniarum]ARS36607.1 hypothetical protein CA264_14930 [Pontibacter actiniarum]
MDTDNQPLQQPLTDLCGQIAYSANSFRSQVILEHEKQKAILFAFSEGQELKEHKTSHDVLLIMLEGACEFSIYLSPQVLRAGQVIRIPAHEPHALKALTNFKMVLIK